MRDFKEFLNSKVSQRWSEMAFSDPPTEKQIALLRRLYGNHAQIPANRGEASKLIDAKLKQYNKSQPQQSAEPKAAQPAAAPTTSKTWILGHVIADNPQGVSPGTKVALAKAASGWEFMTLDGKGVTGVLPMAGIGNIVQSEKDANGQPIKTQNIAEWLPKKEKKKQSPLIPAEKMSDEQKLIDAKFEQLMQHPEQSHIMINALAGTGKTTMLKHLAWKYGDPKQRWLYLVFNTKNKVEATEKFPSFVQVRTTNGFLGEVLKDKKNVTKIPQTERIIGLNKYKAKGEENESNLEKARLVVDGPEFQKVAGIPEQVSSHEYGSIAKTVNSLLRAIRYHFKEQVLTLAGLAKSYALDPRKSLDEGIKKILDSYDFDTPLSEVKERIAKYTGSFRRNAEHGLNTALGYPFMEKDYREDIIKATKWLLNATMPQGTQQQYKKGNMDYNLGEFRDFNDDLWFAAIHADEINWPRYDVVLADEVQDFNEAQKIMLKKLHEAGAKIVAVGDPNQSIYRFRGADSEAFSNIGKQLTDLSHDKNVTHNLSTNFRSRKNILDFANEETHVKNLKGRTFDDGGEGDVTKGDVKYDQAFGTLKQEHAGGNMKQTAFIARTNEPLVHAALKLLAQGVPFLIVGKDIAKDLKKHIAKIIARFGITDSDDVWQLSERLEEFQREELDSHEGKSTKKAYLQDLKEVTEALVSAIHQYDGEQGGSRSRYGYEQNSANVAGFKRWISERLGGLDVEENEKDMKEYERRLEEENPVILTTSHKSKGLEFSRVYILRYDLFPHKKAQRQEDLAQEANSKYVALTRAMDELHVLDLEGQPGYKPKD